MPRFSRMFPLGAIMLLTDEGVKEATEKSEGVHVARTPDFGVRGSSLAKIENLKDGDRPRMQEHESTEELTTVR
jgi:hypothetical protein